MPVPEKKPPVSKVTINCPTCKTPTDLTWNSEDDSYEGRCSEGHNVGAGYTRYYRDNFVARIRKEQEENEEKAKKGEKKSGGW